MNPIVQTPLQWQKQVSIRLKGPMVDQLMKTSVRHQFGDEREVYSD